MISKSENNIEVKLGIIGTCGYPDGDCLRVLKEVTENLTDVEAFNNLSVFCSNSEDREINRFSKNPKISFCLKNCLKNLEKSGCKISFFCYPTTLEFIEEIKKVTSMFILDIVEEVKKEVIRKKIKKIFILGDKKENDIYIERLSEIMDLEVIGEAQNIEEIKEEVDLILISSNDFNIRDKKFKIMKAWDFFSHVIDVVYSHTVFKYWPKIEAESLHRINKFKKEEYKRHFELLNLIKL